MPWGPQESTLLLPWKRGSQASCPGSRAASRVISKNTTGKRKDKGEVQGGGGDGRRALGCTQWAWAGGRGQPSPGVGAVRV